MMQVVGFVGETITVCKAFYHGGPNAIDEVKQNASAIASASSKIQDYLEMIPERSKSPDLLDITRKCRNLASELVQKAQLIPTSSAQGSLSTALKATFQTLRVGRRIEDLEKSLQKYASTMVLHILQDQRYVSFLAEPCSFL